MAAFELSFSIKIIFKKRACGKIAFALISFFIYKYKSLQAGQLPQEHLSFLQNLLNCITRKYLKHEVSDGVSIFVDSL